MSLSFGDPRRFRLSNGDTGMAETPEQAREIEAADRGVLPVELSRAASAPVDENDLVYRLRKRAEIRRQIPNRKSVQTGERDRIADLLEEAADEIERLRK
jgi:hypothetical protein